MRWSLLPVVLVAVFLVACPVGEQKFDFDGDGVDDADDCDPEDASIYPGADDPYGDGIDQDCDGFDGIDRDGDGYPANDDLDDPDLYDCDDNDETINPGQDEIPGNEIDEDCDGFDEFDSDGDGTPDSADCAPEDPALNHLDEDGDGWSSCDGDCDDQDAGLSPQDADGDGVSLCEEDCDDDDPTTYPGAEELCDRLDNDCDGELHPGEVDLDLDGYATCEGDCDDANPAVHPGDDDGDGYTLCDPVPDCDDEDAALTPADLDFDGYSTCTGDCDDTEPDIYLGAEELCDGLDNDCDGVVPADEGDGDGDGHAACADCDDQDPATWGFDEDGDGFDPCTGDCDEGNPAIYPGANDPWGDGQDQSCDGADGIDWDGDGSPGNAVPPNLSTPEWDCNDYDAAANRSDADGDGVDTCAAVPDCDDSDPNNYPGNPEVCDGQDNDCDGSPDGDEVDDDGDGVTECDGDCDDADPANFTGNAEVCDGMDNDCDTDIDEGFDADGLGGADCIDDDGDGFSEDGGDCDDEDPLNSPGNWEVSDGQDNDCDGLVDGDDPDVQESIVAAGMTFLEVPAGTFDMGCTAGQSSCNFDEEPAHGVTLTNSLWLGETEVTQGQWELLMGNNPSHFGPNGAGADCGTDCPVEMVNWYEALAFANEASAAEGLAACYLLSGCTNAPGNGMECSTVSVTATSGSVYDCLGYRLPTEAEWEYAARAATDLLYAGSNTVSDVTWYDGNSGSTTHPAATKLPNAWGLYDLSGNVWEWLWDWYGSDYYGSSPGDDPAGPASGPGRVVRGGCWYFGASYTRVADRNNGSLVAIDDDLGFRLARSIP